MTDTGLPNLPKDYVWHVTGGTVAIELYTLKRTYTRWGKFLHDQTKISAAPFMYKTTKITTIINQGHLRRPISAEKIKSSALEVYSNFCKRMKNTEIAEREAARIAELVGYYPPKKLS